MTEKVRFHFDPRCPWAWQSSKWIREVAEARDIDIEWALFSLSLINMKPDQGVEEWMIPGDQALRTMVTVRRIAGPEGMGDVYKAIGDRIHEGDRELDPVVMKEALLAAGLDEGLFDEALSDPTTETELKRDHDEIVERVGAFGVPTLVFESGMSIFGPVIGKPYGPERSAELFDHVKALTEVDGFFELKRERDRKPGQ